ncbi:uncharacterized protein FIESC28_04637 [Fusarium coffeatum]|uniref:CCHC-type domain-containing protein n=1 Tax=Fusarium coffeatum TaxID=231269 RepID=A0A366RZD9_9HYPO|nr:uncharacterized protein FIESC28_04637 [Fusarium coffeatum]RBR22132.1 hypothetical protein FIESC28_04637 [Fusarium coffeatum]
MWEQSPESMAQPLPDKPYDAIITKRQNEKTQTDITCNNCHQTGHRASDCTEPRPCTECGEVGHWRKECPNRRCKWCDKTDHLANECPEDLCLWCFQVGHLAPEAEEQIIQTRGRSSLLEEFNAMDGAQPGTDDYTWDTTQTGTGDITKEVEEANGWW